MLTQLQLTNAKPKSKAYMLSDGRGLHLYIQPSGSKLWRLRFRFAGKANMLSLGSFPEVSLLEARGQRGEIREQIKQGIDPSQKRKLQKIQATDTHDTFGAIAADYITSLEKNGAAEITVSKNKWLLQTLAAPLAPRPITEIVPAEILSLLKKVEDSGRRETAHRLRGTIGSVFRFAIANLKATTDPTYPLRGSLLQVQTKHRAAITSEKDLGVFWRELREYTGWPTLKLAFRFMVLTMTRPCEVRFMRREEVDLEKRVWRIPAERMKMRRPFDVPLSRQALAVLKEALALDHELVFPSKWGDRPLSENAFTSALRNLGYSQEEATAHGFRSSASTILNERGYHPDHIEAALAHQDPNKIRRTHNRAAYWKERVVLLQAWADLLDALATPKLKAA
jgi:integrase